MFEFFRRKQKISKLVSDLGTLFELGVVEGLWVDYQNSGIPAGFANWDYYLLIKKSGKQSFCFCGIDNALKNGIIVDNETRQSTALNKAEVKYIVEITKSNVNKDTLAYKFDQLITESNAEIVKRL